MNLKIYNLLYNLLYNSNIIMDKLKESILINKTSDGRPTFGWSDSDEVIRACGIIIQYTDKNGKFYLIRKEKKNDDTILCDIGGKTDPKDKSIIDTLCREVAEETNTKLFGNHGFAKCKKMLVYILEEFDLKLFYCYKSKYMIVKVIMDYQSVPKKLKYFRGLPMKRFGKIEKVTGMEHYYKWMKKVNKNIVHKRLITVYKKLFN
jgi:hypothetical protein